MSNVACKLNVFTCNHSMMLLLLLLPHLFISICHGRPAASHHHSDAGPLSNDDDDDGNDDDVEPSVFAVFDRNDHVSGELATTSSSL